MTDLLSDVTAWCQARGPAVLWTMMQTLDEGRAGFQLFVMDHANGEVVWSCNAPNLDELAHRVGALLASGLQ